MSEMAKQYSEKTGEPARFVIYPGDFGTEAYHDKYVDHLEKEVERLKKRHNEIVTELYGEGYEVAGFHLNGDLEPLDNWFEQNGWLNERTTTEPADG